MARYYKCVDEKKPCHFMTCGFLCTILFPSGFDNEIDFHGKECPFRKTDKQFKDDRLKYPLLYGYTPRRTKEV